MSLRHFYISANFYQKIQENEDSRNSKEIQDVGSTLDFLKFLESA